MRIRQGNDFIFLWAIERNGEPEDFSNAVNIRLHFKNYDCVGEVESFQIVDGNIVRVEVTPEWASRLGAYRLILSYEFENSSYSDGDQKCVVDVLAFNIVPKTSEADDITEMAKTTDIMIGLNGLSAYEVWLKDNPDKTKEEYYNWLQKPAIDIAETVGLQEQARVEAENLRVLAEQDRQTSTATAISNAETAAENANTAAQNAGNARLAIQDDLALKADQADLVQLESDVEQNSYVKITNLVTNGNFSNGLNGWGVTGQGTASVSNNLATIIGTGTGPINFTQNTGHEASPNDKMYFKAKRRRSGGSEAQGVLYARFESRSGSGSIAINISPPIGEYSYDSQIATLPKAFTEGKLRFVCQNYFTASTSNLGITTEVGNIVVVNLTKTFGAGNEPTKEEFDLLLDILGIDYFEGEITIPAQKVMLWQLAMIRQNRNAIIALGGTII